MLTQFEGYNNKNGVYMNTDLGKPIAYGRTAEIYAWGEDKILKLFYDWQGLDSIEYEARIARAVYASGLPVPAAGDILRINDRNGLVYQRVNGNHMWDVLRKRPWKGNYYARRMAELHVKMHTSNLQVNVPSQRHRLVHKLQDAKALPDQLRAKAMAALEALPDGDQLCHGDFHPGNILVTPQGEVIIDWIDATRGNPLSDLARSTILIRGAAESSQIGNIFAKALVQTIHDEYIRHYFKLRPGGEQEYKRWLPIVAAARLSENIPELEKWLIFQADMGL
jgi:tRNA A-37 threonylcarbamoyl transferase component Bud32